MGADQTGRSDDAIEFRWSAVCSGACGAGPPDDKRPATECRRPLVVDMVILFGRFVDRVLCLADRFLGRPGDLIGHALGLQFLAADKFAGGLLHSANALLGCAFDTFLVHFRLQISGATHVSCADARSYRLPANEEVVAQQQNCPADDNDRKSCED